MASFWFHLMLIISLMIFPLLSSSTHLNPRASSNSTSPPNSASQSPFQELSPDISPLLPSSGAARPSPTEPSIPTIPADPSPPNPDDVLEPGSDPAFAPYGSFPASSSSVPQSFMSLVAYVGCCIGYWSMQLLSI